MKTATERRELRDSRIAAAHAKRDQRMAVIAGHREQRATVRRTSRDDRLAAKEQRAAEHERRKAARAEAAATRPEPVQRFTWLGVQIMDNGDLHTFNGIAGTGTRLGPAAGAMAEVGDERRRHRVSGAVTATLLTGAPVMMAGALGKKAKASAFITLADGTFRERKLEGNTQVSHAHREAAAFAAAILRLEHEQ